MVSSFIRLVNSFFTKPPFPVKSITVKIPAIIKLFILVVFVMYSYILQCICQLCKIYKIFLYPAITATCNSHVYVHVYPMYMKLTFYDSI